MDISDSLSTNNSELDVTMGSILSTSNDNETQNIENDSSANITTEEPSLISQNIEVNELQNTTDSENLPDTTLDNVESYTETLSEQDINLIIMGKPTTSDDSEEVISSSVKNDLLDVPSTSHIEEHEELWLGDNTRQLVKVDTDEDFEVIVKSLETAIVETERYDIDSVITSSDEPVISSVASNLENSLGIPLIEPDSDSLLEDIPSNLLTSAVPPLPIQELQGDVRMELSGRILQSPIERPVSQHRNSDSYDEFATISEPKVESFDEQSSSLFDVIEPEIDIPIENEPSLLELQEATMPTDISDEFQQEDLIFSSSAIVVENITTKPDELDEICEASVDSEFAENQFIQEQIESDICNTNEEYSEETKEILQEVTEKLENDENLTERKNDISDSIIEDPENEISIVTNSIIEKPENEISIVTDSITEEPENEISIVTDSRTEDPENEISIVTDLITEEPENEISIVTDSITEEPENEILNVSDSRTEDPENEISIVTDLIIEEPENEISIVTDSITEEPENEISIVTDSITKEPDNETQNKNQTTDSGENVIDIKTSQLENLFEINADTSNVADNSIKSPQLENTLDANDDTKNITTNLIVPKFSLKSTSKIDIENEEYINSTINVENQLEQDLNVDTELSEKQITSKSEHSSMQENIVQELQVTKELSSEISEKRKYVKSNEYEKNVTESNVVQEEQDNKSALEVEDTNKPVETSDLKISVEVSNKSELTGSTETNIKNEEDRIDEIFISNELQKETVPPEEIQKESLKETVPPEKIQKELPIGTVPPEKIQKESLLKETVPLEEIQKETILPEAIHKEPLKEIVPSQRIQKELLKDILPSTEIQKELLKEKVPPQELQIESLNETIPLEEIQKQTVPLEAIQKESLIETVPPEKIQIESLKETVPSEEIQKELQKEIIPPEAIQEESLPLKETQKDTSTTSSAVSIKHSLDSDEKEQSPPKKIKLVREKFQVNPVHTESQQVQKIQKIIETSIEPEINKQEEKEMTKTEIEIMVPDKTKEIDKKIVPVSEQKSVVEGKETIQQILEKLEDPVDKSLNENKSPVKAQKLKLQRNYKLPQKSIKQNINTKIMEESTSSKKTATEEIKIINITQDKSAKSSSKEKFEEISQPSSSKSKVTALETKISAISIKSNESAVNKEDSKSKVETKPLEPVQKIEIDYPVETVSTSEISISADNLKIIDSVTETVQHILYSSQQDIPSIEEKSIEKNPIDNQIYLDEVQEASVVEISKNDDVQVNLEEEQGTNIVDVSKNDQVNLEDVQKANTFDVSKNDDHQINLEEIQETIIVDVSEKVKDFTEKKSETENKDLDNQTVSQIEQQADFSQILINIETQSTELKTEELKIPKNEVLVIAAGTEEEQTTNIGNALIEIKNQQLDLIKNEVEEKKEEPCLIETKILDIQNISQETKACLVNISENIEEISTIENKEESSEIEMIPVEQKTADFDNTNVENITCVATATIAKTTDVAETAIDEIVEKPIITDTDVSIEKLKEPEILEDTEQFVSSSNTENIVENITNTEIESTLIITETENIVDMVDLEEKLEIEKNLDLEKVEMKIGNEDIDDEKHAETDTKNTGENIENEINLDTQKGDMKIRNTNISDTRHAEAKIDIKNTKEDEIKNIIDTQKVEINTKNKELRDTRHAEANINSKSTVGKIETEKKFDTQNVEMKIENKNIDDIQYAEAETDTKNTEDKIEIVNNIDTKKVELKTKNKVIGDTKHEEQNINLKNIVEKIETEKNFDTLNVEMNVESKGIDNTKTNIKTVNIVNTKSVETTGTKSIVDAKKMKEKINTSETFEFKLETCRTKSEPKTDKLLTIDTQFPLLSSRLQERLEPKSRKLTQDVNITPVSFPTVSQESVSKKIKEQLHENKLVTAKTTVSKQDLLPASTAELSKTEATAFLAKNPEITLTKEITSSRTDHSATMEGATKIKITKRKFDTSGSSGSEPMIKRSVTKPLSVQIDDLESSNTIMERSHSSGTPGQREQESIPKIVIKTIPKSEGRSSPKITIKPIKPPEETSHKSRSSEDSSHSPKITIKPIVKQDPLKITITKQKADDTHSILKIYQPDDTHDHHIPKLTIKPIPKSDEMQHSPRITIKPVKQSPSTSSMSPKITVKPIPSPSEQVEIIHSPKVTVKPVVNPEDSYPKVTIKPVLRPEDSQKVSQLSPRQIKLKSMTFESSSGVTVEPICGAGNLLSPKKLNPESQTSTLKISVKPFAKMEESLSPKLTIKPITKTCEIVQSEDGTTNPLKLTIKPILKPEESSYQSPKITIKPIVKPDEMNQQGEELDKPERIILKIQKTSLPSPKERVKETKKEPEIKIEAIPHDPEKSQRLDKIKLKLTKEGSHAQIIPSISTISDSSFSLKRSLGLSESCVFEKRSKTEFPGTEILHTSDISINIVEPNNAKPCPKTISEEVTIMKIDKAASGSRAPSTERQISQSKFKEMLMKIQQKPDITCTPRIEAEPDYSSSDDDVKIVEIIDNDPLKDPLSLNDESNSQDVMIVDEVINTNPFQNVQIISAQSTADLNSQTPKKRGRPRKNPLEVKPEIKGEDCVEVRPKRTCRAPPGRTPFAVKERKPRGAGRGRGSRGRGASKSPQKSPKEVKTPRGKALKEAKALAKIEAARLAQEVVIDEITIEDSTNDTPAATPVPPPDDSPKKPEVKESEPPPQMVEPEVKVSISEEEPKQPPPPAVYEEETRMSAENNSRAQTPARQVFTAPLAEGPEESQSSVQSTATTESSKTKKGRLEVCDPDSAVTTVDQIVEYSWANGGPYMLQEQIAQYLGVKSFKRKYPGLTRRPVEMQERDYIREKGLVSESMCDMGLTAVPSSEILDIMYSDFQEKYEEYRKCLRDKQAKEISNKQKAVSLATSQEKNKIDFKERAIRSAASWNVNFNKARKDTRKCCMDLQTFTINYPAGKMKVPHKTPVGHYPLALVPGQYTDYYKSYTTNDLHYLPLNTVRYGPVLPNQRCDPGQSDGSQSDSDSSSGSDSDSSDDSMSTEEETPATIICKPASVQLTQLITTPKSKNPT